MKKIRLTGEKIIEILKLRAAGGKAGELCRQHGISEATLYNWLNRAPANSVAGQSHRDMSVEYQTEKSPTVSRQLLYYISCVSPWSRWRQF